MRSVRGVALGLVATLVTATAVHAQVTGRVIGRGEIELPGVSVTAESDALPEGSRTAVTDENGRYDLGSLPPGLYTWTFALSGFGSMILQNLEFVGAGSLMVNGTLHRGIFDACIRADRQLRCVATARLPPGAAGSIQPCLPLPDNIVGPCEPVVDAPSPPR